MVFVGIIERKEFSFKTLVIANCAATAGTALLKKYVKELGILFLPEELTVRPLFK